MHKFIRALFSFIMVIFITSVVIAFFMNLSSGPDEFEIAYTKTSNNSKRVAKTGFSVPLSHVAGNNYFWYNAAQASIESDAEFNKSFTNIDSTFFRENDLGFASFEIAYSGLLDSDMSLNKEKLGQLVSYFDEARLTGKEALKISDIQWLSPYMGQVLSRLNVNYASVENRVERAIAAQFMISGKLLAKHANGGYGNVVIELGHIPVYDLKTRSLAGAKATAIYRIAKNLVTSWSEYEKNNGPSNIRILLKNSYYSDVPENKKLLEQKENYILGEDVFDLREVRRDIFRYNRALGSPIKDIRERVGYAVDMSNLVGVWQSETTALYKDASAQPLELNAFIDTLLRDRRGFIKYGFRGETIENPIHLIYASYNRSVENNDNNTNEQYLPYTRTTEAKRANVLNQLKLLTEVYERSQIGGQENDGFIVLAIPRSQLFPFYHNTIKPFYKLMAALKISNFIFRNSTAERSNNIFYYRPPGRSTWSTEIQPNLAKRWEQEYSLDLVKNYLIAKVK